MDIRIKTIPHSEQRYPTVGDWDYAPDHIWIHVSDMWNWKYHALVAVHELCEALICKHQDIRADKITAFDIKFEEERKEGDTSEPGDSPEAPYRTAHFIATTIERILALALGVNWGEYSKTVESL